MPDPAIDAITEAELIAIFGGELETWREGLRPA
jgi:hypothetical protein